MLLYLKYFHVQGLGGRKKTLPRYFLVGFIRILKIELVVVIDLKKAAHTGL